MLTFKKKKVYSILTCSRSLKQYYYLGAVDNPDSAEDADTAVARVGEAAREDREGSAASAAPTALSLLLIIPVCRQQSMC